jgi:hypothetical protein
MTWRSKLLLGILTALAMFLLTYALPRGSAMRDAALVQFPVTVGVWAIFVLLFVKLKEGFARRSSDRRRKIRGARRDLDALIPNSETLLHALLRIPRSLLTANVHDLSEMVSRVRADVSHQ